MLKAASKDHHIIIITARDEAWRGHTAYWLARYGIQHDALFMRADEDFRDYVESKRDALLQILTFWDVVHAVDDDPAVIALWEEHGIPTTKIGDWSGKN